MNKNLHAFKGKRPNFKTSVDFFCCAKEFIPGVNSLSFNSHLNELVCMHNWHETNFSHYEVTGYWDFEYSGGNTRERGLGSLRNYMKRK